MSVLTLISRSADETEELGRQLGSILKAGQFIALRGELGGGKTCFTRGIVAAAAPDALRMVASPTFAIMNEYPGTPTIYHFDFYRLTCAGEIAELGFEDYFNGCGICIVEWSERLGDMVPRDRLEITFVHAGSDNRNITLQSTGTKSLELLERLAEQARRKKNFDLS